MRKHKFIALAVGGILACVGEAAALPVDNPIYQDIDAIGTTLGDPTAGYVGSVSGTFDILNASGSVTIDATGGVNGYANGGTTYTDIGGFVPGGGETILAANAFFYIQNDTSLGYNIFVADLTDWATATGGSSEFSADSSHYILGNGLDSAVLTILNNNGVLNYTVEWTAGGSLTLDYAQLQVTQTGQGYPATPDAGSTVSLLGLALTGLGGWRFGLKKA